MKKEMKKLLVMLSLVTLVCIAFSSCDDGGDSSKSCTCTEYDETGSSYGSKTIDPASWGATNCSDLEVKLRKDALQSGYNSTFSCH